MKKTLQITAILMLLLSLSALAQDKYVMNQSVNIPFSAALGVGVAKQRLPLGPGQYNVTLTVERAAWDRNPNSVADMVNIGGQYLIQDNRTGRDVQKSNWFTRNGWLGWGITVPQNCTVYLFYSTIAPGGAKGRLTVEAM